MSELSDSGLSEWVEIAEWDRVTASGLTVLHHLALFDARECDRQWGGPGTSECGITKAWWSIPGMGSRMSAPRCGRCCKALGYPPGVGSPKNDDACRLLALTRIWRLGDAAVADEVSYGVGW